MSITYGINVLPKNDPYIAVAEEAIAEGSKAVMAGAFLVDVIPALKYIPDWMPFAGFKRMAKEARKLAQRSIDDPFQVTKRDMVKIICYSSMLW